MQRPPRKALILATLLVLLACVSIAVFTGRGDKEPPPAPAQSADTQAQSLHGREAVLEQAEEPRDDVLDDFFEARQREARAYSEALLGNEEDERLVRAMNELNRKLYFYGGEAERRRAVGDRAFMEERERLIQEFFNEFPPSEATWHYLSTLIETYGAMGRCDDAWRVYNDTVAPLGEEHRAMQLRTLCELGWMEFRAGNVERAREVFSGVMDEPLPEDDAAMLDEVEAIKYYEAPLSLARIHAQTGRPRDAETFLRQAEEYALSQPRDDTAPGGAERLLLRVYIQRSGMVTGEMPLEDFDEAAGYADALAQDYTRKLGASGPLAARQAGRGADLLCHYISRGASIRRVRAAFEKAGATKPGDALKAVEGIIEDYGKYSDAHKWNDPATAAEWREQTIARLRTLSTTLAAEKNPPAVKK